MNQNKIDSNYGLQQVIDILINGKPIPFDNVSSLSRINGL